MMFFVVCFFFYAIISHHKFFYSEEQANRDIDYSEDETAQEKRLRLAKEYLIQLENEG